MKATKHKACAFCQRSDVKISKEHVIPRWILELYKLGKASHRQMGGQFKHWNGTPAASLQVNSVCKPCNHGWLETMERGVRPLLISMIQSWNKTELNAEQLAKLSAWAYKTAVVFELLDSKHSRYFEIDDRINLYESSAVPDHGVLIWLASYIGPPGLTITSGRIAPLADPHGPVPRDVMAYGVTISISKVALQVLSFRHKTFGRLYGGIRPRSIRAWDDAVINIWPLREGAVFWPPRVGLDNPGMLAFNDRWLGRRP
jgi:hypothetical protein